MYIGSTLKSLAQRLKEHHSAKAAYDAGDKSKKLTSFPLLEDGVIELVEIVSCDDLRHLRVREHELVKTMDCVNVTGAPRSTASTRFAPTRPTNPSRVKVAAVIEEDEDEDDEFNDDGAFYDDFN